MKMIKAHLLIVFMLCSMACYCQVSSNQINELVKVLKANLKTEQEIKQIIDGIIHDPQLYNSLWKNFVDQASMSDSAKWKWLRDLNLQFKTFQTDDNPNASLGLTYDINFDYANFRKQGKNRVSGKFSFSATGNVAFKKEFNPIDFLDTKVNYSYSRFVGGVVSKPDTAVFSELNRIEDLLVNETDPQSPRAQVLWEEFGRYLTYLTNITMRSHRSFPWSRIRTFQKHSLPLALRSTLAPKHGTTRTNWPASISLTIRLHSSGTL